MVRRRQFIKAGGVAVACTLSGCMGGGDSDEESIIIQSGPAGTSFYSITAPLGQIINEHSSDPAIDATIAASGGSTENVRAVADGEVEASVSMGSIIRAAYRGEAPFEQEYEDLRLIMRGELFPNMYVVQADSDIESVEDLEGKTVSAGPAGSGLADQHPEIMDIFGIETEQVQLEHGEGGGALRDGDIDAWYIFLGADVQNALATADLRVVGFNDDQIETLLNEYPALDSMELTSDRLSGMEGSAQLIAEGSWWMATPDLSDDIVHEICRVALENPDPIIENNTNSADFGPEFAYFDIGVPYHDGATQYFEENDVL